MRLGKTIMCLCVLWREKIGGGDREREGHCSYYDPLELGGLGGVCGGGNVGDLQSRLWRPELIN